MCPELFKLPFLGRGVPAYGTMLMVGFLLAVFLARRRCGALGLERPQVFDLGFLAVIGGIVGARLLHIALYWPDYFSTRALWPEWMGPLGWIGAMLATWKGGLVYYGGLGGAIAAVWLYGRRKGIPLTDMLDFSAPPAALGLALTRIGCFLNGCCYGGSTGLPWGVKFPQGSHAYAIRDAAGRLVGFREPFHVHPAQLYEMLAALGIFGLLWYFYPRRRFSGAVAWSFGLLYAVWRFLNEFARADSGPWRPAVGDGALNLGPLTVFQYISIPLIAFFAIMLVVARRRARPPYAPPSSEGGAGGASPRAAGGEEAKS
ncbi:MAG: prolipoprotein diacylglyceryl transferase [Planctomycetota bacterium]|jgi:phosphatidylglycerol:prolipoprotein diacylglycerol transferase